MKILLRIFLLFGFTVTNLFGFSQGLPPGWDFTPTPLNHIISIPLIINPNINGVLLSPGDYIGVFYLNNQGILTCGGAVDWTGTANTGLIAFGDDNFTPEKDGFSPGELMQYKVFSWDVGHVYSAVVTCNPALPSSCTNFTSNGLCGLASLNASGLFVTISASPSTICVGSSSQLNANVTGGNGNYNYSWSSEPPGFSSNLQNPVVSPVISTQYFVSITEGANSVSSNLTVVVVDLPTVFAGNSVNICENQNVQLSGTAANESSVSWSTSGDGSFSSPYLLNPIYILGFNDVSTGTVSLTLTALPVAPCASSGSSTMVVDIFNLPLVDAGVDITACEATEIQLTASANNYSSILWTTSGDGSFNNVTILNPTYLPGNNDIIAGNAQLTILVSPVSPCLFTATDIINIGIQPLPLVNSGDNELICEGGVVSLSGNATNFTNVLWETMGDGIFDNPTELTTNYFPGTNDIFSGSVSVSLTAFPVFPCGNPATEQLLINIVAIPDVFAGIDATICETGIHQVSGIANNYEEVVWTTGGDGSFGDPNLLSTTYSPGQLDINNGTVGLLLTVFPEFPCSVVVQDEIILNIAKLPLVNAGEDALICENNVIEMTGIAFNYIGIQWFTDGDGTFSDPLILEPVYFPGINDILTGEVNLRLSAFPLPPCNFIQEDSLVVVIIKMPVVDAGEDATIKSNESITLSGFAQNFSSIEWNTDGDGTFDELNILNPVYTPGLIDIANTIVNLGLTSNAIFPCAGNAIDALVLTIDTITTINGFGSRKNPDVYPNPNRGEFKIVGLNLFGDEFHVEIFTMEGKIVFSEIFINYENKAKDVLIFNVNKLENGIYLLKVFNSKHLSEQKIIVLRE